MNFETTVKKYLVDITVNSQEQEPMVIYGMFRLLTGLWILTTGFWYVGETLLFLTMEQIKQLPAESSTPLPPPPPPLKENE